MATLPRSGLAGLVRFWLDKVHRTLSVPGLVLSLPASTLAALFLGWSAGQTVDDWMRGLAFGIGAIAVVTSFVFALGIVANSVKAVSTLFVTRYGKTEMRRAEDLVTARILDSKPVRFHVVGGELVRLKQDKPEDGQDMAANEGPMEEMFRIAGWGPGSLLVDHQSACLVENKGVYRAMHGLEVKLGADDRYWGSVPLTVQKEPFEISEVYTRDRVPLLVKGSISFQIRQDMNHLKMTSRHYAYDAAVQRALLPDRDWRKKTIGLARNKILGVAQNYALLQIFWLPSLPETPEDVAKLDAIRRKVVPVDLRLEWQERVKAQLNPECEQWGIEVKQVQIDQIQAPHEIIAAAEQAFVSWSRLRVQLQEAKLRTVSNNNLTELEAETSKKKDVVLAEGEADAYRKRMHARAEGLKEFVRSVEEVKKTLGPSVDKSTMHELLMALGLVTQQRRQDGPTLEPVFFTKGKLSDREEWE